MDPTTVNVPDFFPHRHPFLLIDQVEEISEDLAVATKAVTRTEPWFTGHFPDRPIFPGVLLLEAMAQSGRFLTSLDRRLVSARLARIDSVRFFREVVPGETIRMEARRIGELGAMTKFRVDATVAGERCASAEFTVHSVMADRDSSSSSSESASFIA